MLVRRVASACVWGGCIWSPMRLQSQSSRGLPSTAWSDGAVDPRFAAGPTNARTLNPDTMAHYVKATIQNDRREMGLGQIVDWAEFAKEAIFIPTRSGPLWVGADDPRAAKFVRRREKMRAKPLQKARPKAGPDPAAALESHPLREYFTTPTNINDPLSVATGLHRAGMIKEMDIKHTAAKMAYAPRPPIVSIMGHVDHGKTTLLDFLRKTNVASAEAGGITQNVGAFCVRTGTDASGKDRIITFIDTPGHAAFSAMREAGAAANDIIVLIVSAVDGVQPQTREVLDLATRNGLPLVVAISKIDRQPNCQQVMAQLRDAGVELEEDGGDVQVVKICARDGSGVPQLLEALQLQAELCEISSPQPARAELTVMESQRSAVHEVSAIVRTGTVRVGQVFVAGMTYGVVRRLINESGEGITSAGPSTPVVLHGFSVSPKPGSILMQVSSEKHAEKFHFFMKEVYQVEGGREGYLQLVHAEQRGQFYARKPDNNLVRSFSTKAFLLTCKAATFGMLQALMRMVYELPRLEGVSVEMKLTEVGGLQDHDLGLMGGSGRPGCILIFGDCRDANTLDVPDQIKVIRFDVLYHGLEQLKELLVDALPKVAKTRILATAECLQTFKASQAGKNGNAGGMRVVSGTLDAAHPTFRVMRRVRRPAGAKAAADEAEQREVVYEGQLKELRRFKDLVPSVEEGLECGVILRDEFIFKTGDRLEQVEAYEESRDVAEEFEAAERRERILRETASLQEGLAEEAATTSDEKA